MDLEMTSDRGDELLNMSEADRDGLTQDEIMKAWTEWLYDQHGALLPERALDAIYARAWEEGHSSGLRSVEDWFIDLVGLVVEVIEIVR
jgi:hypothetical protein